MPDPILPRGTNTSDHAALPRHLLRSALVVMVMGVLPFVLDASATWQVLGTIVSVTLVTRSLQLIWQAVFSTDPRHLAPL